MTKPSSPPSPWAVGRLALLLACGTLCLAGACQQGKAGKDADSPADRPAGSGGAKQTGDAMGAAGVGGGPAGLGGTLGTGGLTFAGGTTGAAGTVGGSSGGGAGPGGSTAGTGGKDGSGTGGTTAGGKGTGGVTSTGGSGPGGAIGTGGLDAGSGPGGASTGGATAKAGGASGTGGGAAGTSGTSVGGTGGGGATAGLPTAADILALLEKVIPYQIKLGPEDPSWVNKWTEGTFYIGVMAAYLTTGQAELLTDASNWAAKNKWTLLGSPTRNADNQCAGQVYEDIFLASPATADASMVASTKTNIDAMVAAPKPGISKSNGDDWWWCDALFMAPGAISRLGKLTGDNKYYSFLATMWSATQAGLLDTKTGLFWRDSTFVNGSVYWSRGNGWVMGGLVRVLQYLPATDASRDAYVALLRTMATAVVPYQQADGTWHADLTHPTKFDNPETSGTGLITYALAYGINQELLDRPTYQPVVAKAWKGLVSAVDGQGRVGYIQATGSAPAAATATETHDYGVGAWVLAASEIYLMVK